MSKFKFQQAQRYRTYQLCQRDYEQIRSVFGTEHVAEKSFFLFGGPVFHLLV